jgi:hypothetical protein
MRAPARLPSTLAAVLALFLLFLLAAPAAAGEEPPVSAAPPAADEDPAAVGRLLLSPDAAVRAEGVRRLLARIAAGGDLAPFAQAMADAQAAWVSEGSLPLDAIARLAREGAERDRREGAEDGEGLGRIARMRGEAMVRWIVALRERAAQRRAVATASPVEETPGAAPGGAVGAEPAEPGAPPPSPAPSPPAAQGSSPAWVAEVLVVEVARAAAERLVRAAGVGAGGDLVAVSAPLAEAAAWRAAALALPDAVAVAEGVLAGPEGSAASLPPPRALRYRRDVAEAQGAWRVQLGQVPSGYEVVLHPSHDPAGATLELRLRHFRAPAPVGVARVSPAAGVEPLDVDQVEWETASATLSAPVAAEGGAVLALFPALGERPERVPVLVVAWRRP